MPSSFALHDAPNSDDRQLCPWLGQFATVASGTFVHSAQTVFVPVNVLFGGAYPGDGGVMNVDV